MSSIEGGSRSFDSLFSFSADSVESRGEVEDVEVDSELKEVDDLSADDDTS